jgi:hypothetical protein
MTVWSSPRPEIFGMRVLEPDFRTRIVNGWETRGNGLQTAGSNCRSPRIASLMQRS